MKHWELACHILDFDVNEYDEEDIEYFLQEECKRKLEMSSAGFDKLVDALLPLVFTGKSRMSGKPISGFCKKLGRASVITLATLGE